MAEQTITKDIVVMAGAGVSVGPPTALPGWTQMASAIATVLTDRLVRDDNKFEGLPSALPQLEQQRKAKRLPPDYQAQVIEEIAGIHYFEGLQALDVTCGNAAHEAIADLAATGRVKAIVTTNFDRLIEQALTRRSVPFDVARSDDEFQALAGRLLPPFEPIPIIKIHGCVSSASSMIDTLKQRRRGRTKALQKCLDALSPARWIFAGFSADDLETEGDYLGFVSRAKHGTEAMYILHPGSALRAGAVKLRDAYSERWELIVDEVDVFITKKFAISSHTSVGSGSGDTGLAQFNNKLKVWAESLQPFVANLCLSAIHEAAGEGDLAARILDVTVRKYSPDDDRTSDGFAACQLHYGRLGAAWGRYAAVPDMNGAESNASVESLQSLMRLVVDRHDERAVVASAWLILAFLWRGHGERALGYAAAVGERLTEATPTLPDELILDSWLAIIQAFLIDASHERLQYVMDGSPAALRTAERSGDVVRAARVAAFHLLALAHTYEDVRKQVTSYEAVFSDVRRVHDGLAEGIRDLALGRWWVGGGGARHGGASILERARLAAENANRASRSFDEQGLDSWNTFLLIQAAMILGYTGDLPGAESLLGRARSSIERFPILLPHLYEAVGCIRATVRDTRASESFAAAVDYAKQVGLPGREKALRQYLDPIPNPGS
jgi:hypothetical protein